MIRQKVIKIFPIIISLIAIAIYIPSLNGEFVIDDVTYFKNDIFSSLTPYDLKAIFLETSNYWGEHLPLRDYIYVLQYQLFEDWTAGYHIISLVLYVLCAFVLYFWIKRLVSDYMISKNIDRPEYNLPVIAACISMMFFLLNPLYVESVAYISGQKDILSLLFVLLSVSYLYKAGRQASNGFWSVFLLGTLFHYMALLSKLSALSTIIFIPFLWLITSNKNIKEILKMTGIWLLANIPVLLWFNYVMNLATQHVIVQTPFLERIPRAINIIGIHISRIIWPWPLSFGYPFANKWQFDLYFVIGLLFILCALFFIVKKGRSLITLGLVIFGIYLLPVLQIYPEIPNAIIFDRYLAMPVIGLFIVLIMLLYKLYYFWKRSLIVLSGALIIISVCWVVVTVNYIPTFRNNIAVRGHLYNLYPEWNSAADNLAYVLIMDGQLDKAEMHVLNAKSFETIEWERDYYLGYIALLRKDYEKAYKLLYSSAVQTSKKGLLPRANNLLAHLFILKGNYELARTLATEVLNNRIQHPVENSKARYLLRKIDSLENQ